MKTIYRFLFSDGVLTPSLVEYLVPIGTSNYEQSSLQWLERFTHNDNRFFFAKNSAQVADFISAIWHSFPTRHPDSLETMMRRRTMKVSPVDLRRFLSKFPPTLLNSDKVYFQRSLSAFL